MKRKININWIMLFILIPLYACSLSLWKTKEHREIISLLSQKWVVNTGINHTVKEILPAESYSTVEFNNDGSIIFDTTDSAMGSWKYNKNTKSLIVKVKGKDSIYRILKITEKELILENNTDGQTRRSYLSKIDF